MITHSLVVIGHRAGNPKGIKDWADLAKPGVGVLYPDPKTSGGARWNINAIYGAAYLASREAKQGKPDLDAVRDFLAKVQANVVNMDQSGRQSMANFAERGTGDAVVTYENELLLRNKDRATPIPYVIPPRDALIESPAAIVETLGRVARQPQGRPRRSWSSSVSEQGQRIFADYGFRPVKDGVAPPRRARSRCRRSSSRWPTWAAGRRSSRSCTGPRGCGRRSSPRTPASRRRGGKSRWRQPH